jgi:hypothetical protein
MGLVLWERAEIQRRIQRQRDLRPRLESDNVMLRFP